MTSDEREERSEFYQALACARRSWEAACDQIDKIEFPSRSPDTWAKAVAARDAAFQLFVLLCKEFQPSR